MCEMDNILGEVRDESGNIFTCDHRVDEIAFCPLDEGFDCSPPTPKRLKNRISFDRFVA